MASTFFHELREALRQFHLGEAALQTAVTSSPAKTK